MDFFPTNPLRTRKAEAKIIDSSPIPSLIGKLTTNAYANPIGGGSLFCLGFERKQECFVSHQPPESIVGRRFTVVVELLRFAGRSKAKPSSTCSSICPGFPTKFDVDH
jgi:hypothetical protein